MSRIIKCVAVHDTPYVVKAPPHCTVIEKKMPEIKKDTITESIKLDAEQKAREYLDEARQEAERIMQSAHEEAERIIAEAKSRADELCQKASESGYQDGHQEGFSEGEASAQQKLQQTLNESVEQAQATLELAAEEAERTMEEAQEQIIEISLAVAEKILFREIQENELVILPILKAAMDKVRDQDKITIRVHPEKYGLVLEAKSELVSYLSGHATVTVQADETLKIGDVFIETPYGNVDARIDSQFETVKAALKGVAL
ncbi:MAG: Flagellar assembly protein FliH/Type secretion system HrpE [Firmicutes bacterium]|nr:Flagellar assembly protein FliH/Type secretion system HrpE [Bacillota bacterium]